MFRRRSAATVDSPGQDGAVEPDSASSPDGAAPGGSRPGVTAGKGRPTPKRSEAEKRRRQPVAAPGDRKAANRQYRERERQDRARKTEAMRRGEEWALPPRDRGQVKALARDYVDSRRRLSEFYMYGLVVLMVMLFIRNAVFTTLVPVIVLAVVLIMLGEGIYLGRRIRSMVAQRYPGESTRGVALYAAMRALQIRKLRVPKPRIKIGDSF